ncbi:hepatocyte growth factor receptor-like [Octopus vulgaris]|uniref:receptor protein-tyrosine kinase n=1 Tax=Octopus vulgaris TaxID=6645 RepID=A0AA36AKP9_OCTVU|nr:hepatocyte growth factor receptor-like [Octopus vulgaris]
MQFLLLLLGCFFLAKGSLSSLLSFKAGYGKLSKISINSRTNDVYVGGINGIYHLDHELKVMQSLNIKSMSNSAVNNTVTVLAIEPNFEYLFVCGTIKKGACTFHNLDDITKKSVTSDTRNASLIGNQKSVVAFFEKSQTSVPYMYVAMAYDGRAISDYPFTISERKIQRNLQYHKISFRNNLKYVMANRNVPVEFIYGFKYSNFIFYVSVRNNDSTYLLRVCEEDENYYYIEIKLYCWLSDYKIQYSTAARFTYLEGKPVLLVAYWSEEHKRSAVCEHSMTQVKWKIMQTISSCSKNSHEFPKYSPWVITDEYCSEVAHDGITEETCGIADNVYISRKMPMAESASFNLSTYITAIQLYTAEHRPVYLLGTKDGHLLKMRKITPENMNHIVMDYDVSEGSGHPIERDLELIGNKTAYVLSGSKVTRFPLVSCSVYSSCRTCVTANDVIKCGWCKNKCTTHSACKEIAWYPDFCKPVITSIYPKSGPFEGKTVLTIKGDYFTNKNDENAHIQVHIKDKECIVLQHNETMIKCLTQKQKDNVSSIHVTAKALSKVSNQPNINGQNSSDEFFYFYKPEIYNFTPKFGPKSGGTKCTITGTKLNIGSSATVIIESRNFTIVKRTDTEIIAKTPSVDFLGQGSLRVIIDGSNMKQPDGFTYTEDPTISHVNSTHSIQSGGINIEFSGTNLNTVREPRLSGITVESKQPLSTEPCHSNKEGTWLYCKSPKIPGISTKQIIPVDTHLLMDGVVDLYNLSTTKPMISRFRYYPDPIIKRFSGDNNVFEYCTSAKEVEIKGTNITLVARSNDINITIDGRIPCKITKLALSFIKCVPQNMPSRNVTKKFKLEVKVYIGYLSYEVGWLLYVDTKSIFTSATVIALIVALCVILILIAVTCYCLWKKKVFSKKRQIPHTARYFNGGEVSLDVFGRLLPTTTNEYTERQDSPGATTYATGATSGIPLIDEDTFLLLKDQKLLIPKEALLMKDKIGQGHFGCVHRAFLFKPGEKGESLVAVKTLHKDNPREIDVKAFLTEAIIMKDFDHENILSLIGICLGKDQMPLVVLPYMLHGDLLSYLRDVNNQPTIKDLIVFGISIASGMDYLSGLKFVHRDLAARNCMLDEKLVVKVADFGLSRDIYERDYYSSDNKKSKLPVKWMALESLETGNYNIKTDVWSYGVVLWELFTRGVNPYPTVDNWDMPKFLKSGRRMDKPDYCPSKTYEIMLRCWQVDQNLRPDFATIVDELTELSQIEKHGDIAISQIMCYENVNFALNNNIKPTVV